MKFESVFFVLLVVGVFADGDKKEEVTEKSAETSMAGDADSLAAPAAPAAAAARSSGEPQIRNPNDPSIEEFEVKYHDKYLVDLSRRKRAPQEERNIRRPDDPSITTFEVKYHDRYLFDLRRKKREIDGQEIRETQPESVYEDNASEPEFVPLPYAQTGYNKIESVEEENLKLLEDLKITDPEVYLSLTNVQPPEYECAPGWGGLGIKCYTQ